MGGKSPRWESQLWSYIGDGDGTHCPLLSCCHDRQKGDWCLDDNKRRISQLIDSKRFNLTDYDFVEHAIPEGTCEIGKMVENLALGWLSKGRIHCLPVPAELILLADEQHPIEVRLLPLKSYHAAIWRLKDRWVIQVSSDDTPAAKRFTLFHEAFHILAHCRTDPVFRKRGASKGSFNELLADYFSACILLPREWIKEKWVELHDLGRMARTFDVPKSVMCIRLKRLGLI